jgi:hypothetical protein
VCWGSAGALDGALVSGVDRFGRVRGSRSRAGSGLGGCVAGELGWLWVVCLCLCGLGFGLFVAVGGGECDVEFGFGVVGLGGVEGEGEGLLSGGGLGC